MAFELSRFGIDHYDLPETWRSQPVGDLADLNPEQIGRSFPYDSIQYLDIGNVTRGTILMPLRVSRRDAPSRAQRIVRDGDTIIAAVRPGNRAYAFLRTPPDDLIVSTGFIVLRPKRGVDPRYLYYLVTCDTIIDYLATIAEEKSAYPSVVPHDIAACIVPVPPETEQCAIAHILGTLDDKIELNRRMSETLEQMARALFKSWFVDFDPVRRNAARARKETAPHPAGCPSPIGGGEQGKDVAESAAFDHLFPDRFVDSELGKIPEGWEPAQLPELVEVNPFSRLRRGDIAPYLDMANMPTQGHAPDVVVERPFGSGMRFINGDTLVARITPCLENGKTAFVDFLREGQVGWGSTEYIVLRTRPPLPPEFAYCLARSTMFRDFVIQRMTGTSGRQRVQPDSLAHLQLPRVPQPVAQMFGRATEPLFARSSAAVRESRTLTTLRDALLPKLISGELRVHDAERLIGRAG